MSEPEMKAAGVEPGAPDRSAHLEAVRPSTVPLPDDWAMFWARLEDLFQGWTPEALKRP